MGNLKSTQKTVNYVLVGVLVLAFSKIALGFYFASSAIIADGIHSLGDALIIALISIALKFISKKPSEKFPYGYYKVEDFVVLILSITFFALAISIIFESLPEIFLWSTERKSIYAAAVAFIAGLVSLALSIIQGNIAKSTNIQSISMNAKEMKYDSIASIFVGIALLTSSYLSVPMDSIASLVLSIFIIRIAIEGAKDAILDLLDAWGKPALIEKIKEILKEEKDILEVTNVRLRKAGPLILGDATIYVPESLDLSDVRELESRILDKLRALGINDFLLHIIPIEERIIRIAIPISDNHIYEHFGRAPKLAIYEIDRKVKSYRQVAIVNNPFVEQKELVGINLAKLLSKHKINAVIIRKIGENAFYMLKGHKIRIFRANTEDIQETIRLFMDGKLLELEEPIKKR